MDELLFEMVTLGSWGYCCSQILMILALKSRSAENPDLVRAMPGLCHSGGTCRGPCWVLTGAACVLALYAGKGADGEDESERLPLMLETLDEWFAETPGNAYGGTACGDLLQRGLARIGCQGVPHGPVPDPRHTLSVIRDQAIDALVGIPVQVLSLVRSDAALQAPAPRVRSVLLTTDHVPHAVKRAVEASWPCRVFNHYGMSEMGLGGGVECEARDGTHLREADLHIEIVDPETGRSLPDGDEGEIVFTTLTRRGMPLIRYRTGDLGRLLTDPCPCGSVLRRLSRVRTRVNGRPEVMPGHRLTLADLDEAVFPIPWVVDFQAALTGENGKETLELACRVNSRAPEGAEDTVRRAAGRIAAVEAAVRAGRLEIAVTCSGSLGLPVSTGAGKRVLADRRRG